MRIVTIRKAVIVCAILGAAVFGVTAFADGTGLYLGGALGANRLQGVGENSWRAVPMGSLGYAFSNGLRPEVEMSYRYSGTSDGNTTARSAMANLYYDIWNDGYYFSFGGGVGKSRLNLSDVISARNFSNTDIPVVWQAGFGFGGALTEHLTLGLDFRELQSFKDTQFSIDSQTISPGRYKTQTISLQLRYSFWGTSNGSVAKPVGTQPVQVVPVR